MKENTKKKVVIGVLFLLCVGVATGIGLTLYRNTDKTVLPKVEVAEEDVKIGEIEEPSIPPADIQVEVPEVGNVNSQVQQLQPDPVKPEAPSEPPELIEDADLENPDKEPEYKEDTEEESGKPDEPTSEPKPDDEDHGNAVYVEGFGWIESSGEPSQSIYDPDMYENGNKVGDM